MRLKESRIEQQDKAQEYPTQVANHWNQQEQQQPRRENHLTRLNLRRGRALLPICVSSTSQARSSRRRSPKSTPRKKINPYRKKKEIQKHLTKEALRVLWLATRTSPTKKSPNSMVYCFNRSWTATCWKSIIVLPSNYWKRAQMRRITECHQKVLASKPKSWRKPSSKISHLQSRNRINSAHRSHNISERAKRQE